MRDRQSSWRVGDGVAYEHLRRALDTATQAILERAIDAPSPGLVSQITELRREVLAVDGFDREAIDRLRAELEARLTRQGGRW